MFEPPKISPLKSAASTIGSVKRSPRLMVIAAAAVIAVAGLGAWLIWGADSASDTYLTQRVRIGSVEDSVTALGNIQPLQFVDVGTQVSGQLRTIHVDYGQSVKKGDLLAEIDPTIYQSRVNADEAQLMNLRAQLAQRQAQKALAEQQFARQKELIKENATSQDAFESAESNLKVNVAQIAQLQAQIKQTESTLSGDLANLGYTKIYAPMDGTVVNLIAKEGQTLNANQTAPLVLRIADLATMTVYAQVSEADVPKLKVGMRAYFTTLGISDKRRYGTLRQIIPTPEVVNNVVLYNCLFDVPNPEGDLLPQMSAQVYFVAAEAHDVPLVSVSALHQVRGGGAAPATAMERKPRYTVRVLEDGEPVTRDVEVGVMNRLVAEIKSGLQPDEEVILDAPPGGTGAGGTRPANPQQQRGPGGGGGGPRL